MNEASFWRGKLLPYTGKSDLIASWQVLATLLPFALLWMAYAECAKISLWFALPFSALLTLFILRSFVLMHDCGHGSLFETKGANQIVGFVFGVITGMPQYVWSKNHAYHHNTNGDWVRYKGVFNILSTDQYDRLTDTQKRRYWLFRQPLILIPAGFFYVLFNPRFNWLAGNVVLIGRIARLLAAFRLRDAIATAKACETKFWKSKKDYVHMTYNNLVLLTAWAIMCSVLGAGTFFLTYVLSTSLAGSIGILLFTIQHNFEDSYATDTDRVNYYRAAIEGTSFLVLPQFLNWFTADIAYHHIHHLSIAVPNYRLAACHRDLASLFGDVKRVHCRDLLKTFEFQLWDPRSQKIVSKTAPRAIDPIPEMSTAPSTGSEVAQGLSL